MKLYLRKFMLTTLASVSSVTFADPFQYLEEVNSSRALEWVTDQTEKTKTELESYSEFQKFNKEAYQLLTSNQKIISVSVKGDYVYHLLQDEKYVKGLWRRQTLEAYKSQANSWENLLDLDRLSQDESKSWSLKAADCLAPEYSRCILSLSDGGGDAVYLREFNVESKSFSTDGFSLKEGKHRLSWYDANHLIIAPGGKEDALTSSGYPREIYLWTKGTEFTEAKLLYRGEYSDMMVLGSRMNLVDRSYVRIRRMKTFYSFEDIIANGETVTKLITPEDSEYIGEVGPYSIVKLKTDKGAFKQGSVVAYDSYALAAGQEKIELIFEPSISQTAEDVFLSTKAVYVQYLDDVKSRISRFEFSAEGFVRQDLELPRMGTISVAAFDPTSEALFVKYNNFITPDRLYFVDVGSNETELVKSLDSDFNTEDLIVKQRFTRSEDGTLIPYFIVHKKDMIFDGTNPTLLYGYGGFEVSYTSRYSSTLGKLWLDKGGVYVLANIRGGGEYGPRWHRAALKHNRHKAYEDFISVAEDLIASGVTSKKQLGIRGGSNGGLLMGAMFTKRPDLFQAVVCAVPLLDMLRFHKLLAGASWMGEYGNPEVAEDRKYLASYSPYHQIRKELKYPEVLFTTSTKDDRVHPGHARKTAAKMMSMGHKVYFFENPEGGHAGASNLKDKAYQFAMTYSYLWSKLR